MKRILIMVVVLVAAMLAAVTLRNRPEGSSVERADPVAKTVEEEQAPESPAAKGSGERSEAPGLSSSQSVESRSAPEATRKTGFRPLDSDGAKRIDLMVHKLSYANPEFIDLYTLAEKEKQDPAWSPDLAEKIEVSLRSHGLEYDALQIGTPSCSASLCMVKAVALRGYADQLPASNWQRLVGSVFGESWFAENFMDAHTYLADDDIGTTYISIFERKQ